MDSSHGLGGWFLPDEFFVLFIIGLFIFAICVVAYIFQAIGMKQMADNLGIKNSWLSFVPIASYYILGLLIKKESTIKNIELWLLWASIGSIFIGLIPIIGTIISLAVAVFAIYAQYLLFKIYSPKNAVLFLILSIFVPLAGPIIIFNIRNNTPQYTIVSTNLEEKVYVDNSNNIEKINDVDDSNNQPKN